MNKEKISVSTVIIYAGAFMAFLIGSGFATGQEVLQYFTSYGFWGIAGTFTVFALFVYVSTSFIMVGYNKKFEKPNDIYKYYCGKYIGTFFDYFSTLFIYMSYIVMVAGAAATINQQYGIPSIFGGILLVVLSITTVAFGLGKIVNVLGRIGPVVVVLSIVLGLYGIFSNIGGLKEGHEIVPTLPVLRASTNWFLAAASYTGFCMLWLAAFISAIGSKTKNIKDGVLGMVFGVVGFCVAVLIVSLGLLAHIEAVATSQVPSLYIAGLVHPTFAFVFSVIVIAGIYTTAVPLLWTVSSRIINNDKSKNFIIVTIVIGVIGGIIGLKVPFNKLVNVVYVINGYVGFLLLFLMIFKSITTIIKKKNHN
jgi:uncharacterized membrane protein YkvI